MNVRFARLVGAALLALLLAACSAGPAEAGPPRFGFGFRKGTATVTVTLPTLGSVTYDTSIGLSVDTNGRDDLTPRVGASKFYVNSSIGSDSNTCTQAQSAATPKLNIQSAYSCVTDGTGDHILIAQGMSYTRGFGGVGQKGGFSAQYPLVMQSYDPADPTNQAKWGTATGSNRPDINNQGADSTCCGFIASTPVKMYRAYRGLRFDGQAIAGAGMSVFSSSAASPSYLLFENDDFDAVQLSVTGWGADAGLGTVTSYLTHLVVRSSTFHGAWATDGHGQGIYWSAVDGATFEDNAFVKAGWKDAAVRTDSITVGGPSQFAHPLYNNVDGINSIVRRNVFIDGPSDSGILKGGGIYQANLSIYNPFGGGIGNGNLYSIFQPFGVYGDSSYNAFVGDTWCVMTVDFRQLGGSSVHHNACAWSDVLGGVGNGEGLMADDTTDLTGPASAQNISLPTYPIFDHNVLWHWADAADQSIHQSSGTGLIGDIHPTWTNNLWGAATSGSNLINTGATFANAYTQATILSALGYADLASASAAWKANPQLHGWRTGPALFLAGYGVIDPGLVDLTTNMALTVGYANSGQFIGTHDGSTLTFASLPTGVTGDNTCRCWRNDGTGTTGSGTFSVTETPPTGPPHTTNSAWSISPRPVLSSFTVTPSSTTATASVSTNTGSGTLYWMVTTNSVLPDWPHIRAGVSQDHALTGQTRGNQTVSATGAQSISSITGLTASTAYWGYVAQVDGSNNPSIASSFSFTTTSGASWTPASLGASLKAWYDPSDITTLFQNAAGTTAVTADGQSVCFIHDKSGNNFDLSQSTGANCPIYHTSSGKSWLAFNGTSMFLRTTGSPVAFVDGSGQHSAVAAVKLTSTSGFQAVLDADAASRVSQLIRLNSGTAETIAFNTSVTPFTDAAGSVSAGTGAVLSEKTSTSSTEVFVNGTGNGSTAVTPPLQTTAGDIAIGENISGPGAFLNGNFYGGFLESGLIGSTDHSSAVTYYAGKM